MTHPQKVLTKQQLMLVLALSSQIWSTNAWSRISRVQASQACSTLEIEQQVEQLNQAWWQDDVIGTFVEKCQTSAIPVLRQMLKHDESVNLRRVALKGLGQIGGERAIMAIAEALDSDNHVFVRSDAVATLGTYRGEISRNSLLKALATDPEKNVRRMAAESLGQQRDVDAIDGLIESLQVKDDCKAKADCEVQKASAKALSEIGEPAISPLIVLLKTPELTNQYWALVALTKMESEGAIAAIESTNVAVESIFDAAEDKGLVSLDRAPVRQVLSANSAQIPSKPLICKIAWVEKTWPRCKV